MAAQELSPAMRVVLQTCAEHDGEALLRHLLPPGAPNVQRTSLSRTLRRMKRRGLVRLFQKTLAPGDRPRHQSYVQRVVLTDAGRRFTSTTESGSVAI